MIDMTITMQKFSFYAGLTAAQAEPWRPLCDSSAQKLEALVRPDVSIKAVTLLSSAAAADAYYYYCLLAGTRGDNEIVAGSVTVRTDQKTRVEAARALRDSAFAAVRGLLRDDGFAFLTTKGGGAPC